MSWSAGLLKAAVVLGVTGAVGYAVARRPWSGGSSAGPASEAAADETVAASRAAPLSASEATEAERAIDGLALTTGEKRFAQALGKDDFELKVRRTVLAGRHAQEVPGADALGRRYMDEFMQDPEKGLQAIQAGLQELPASEFPMERGTLLLAAAHLPGQSAAVRDMAYQEMTRNVPAARPDLRRALTQSDVDRAVSGGPAVVLPLAAHAAFVKASPNGQAALEGTVAGIRAQKDAGIQGTMAAQFLNRYPAMERELRADVPKLPKIAPPAENLESGESQ